MANNSSYSVLLMNTERSYGRDSSRFPACKCGKIMDSQFCHCIVTRCIVGFVSVYKMNLHFYLSSRTNELMVKCTLSAVSH